MNEQVMAERLERFFPGFRFDPSDVRSSKGADFHWFAIGKTVGEGPVVEVCSRYTLPACVEHGVNIVFSNEERVWLAYLKPKEV